LELAEGPKTLPKKTLFDDAGQSSADSKISSFTNGKLPIDLQPKNFFSAF